MCVCIVYSCNEEQTDYRGCIKEGKNYKTSEMIQMDGFCHGYRVIERGKR